MGEVTRQPAGNTLQPEQWRPRRPLPDLARSSLDSHGYNNTCETAENIGASSPSPRRPHLEHFPLNCSDVCVINRPTGPPEGFTEPAAVPKRSTVRERLEAAPSIDAKANSASPGCRAATGAGNGRGALKMAPPESSRSNKHPPKTPRFLNIKLARPFTDEANVLLGHIGRPLLRSQRNADRHLRQLKYKCIIVFYNISCDGMRRVSFTGRYLSRSEFMAISIRMDPDCV